MTIGTIVSSLLTPAEFYAQGFIDSDSVDNFNPMKSKWLCLTDPYAGDLDISQTELGKLTGLKKAPSMIGMFQRGISGGRNPGDEQADALQGHTHRLKEAAASSSHQPATRPPNGLQNGGYTHGVRDMDSTVVELAGYGTPRIADETRPRNIAVHFYLRVNA